MAIYLALLRGINVGGKNVIRMADLKGALEAIGLARVQTYIQSGNVLFESEEDEVRLQRNIESQIMAVFGLQVPVVLRTAEELAWIISHCPFADETIAQAEAASDVECMYVGLMAGMPSADGFTRWLKGQSEGEAYKMEGKNVYLLLHHGIRASKLANTLDRLGVPVTVRNWKTLNQLHLLAEGMKG